MDLKELAKQIFLMGPQTPFSEEDWNELPEDDDIKEHLYHIAKSVAVMILEARIDEGKEHLQLKIQESHDRIADLETQKQSILTQ